jgi:hypothetical protein
MVKLSCMGKIFGGDHRVHNSAFCRTLRSVNTGFGLGNCIRATCDFNLTTMIEVDYSLSDWFRSEYGGKFGKKGLVFWGNL